MFVFVCVSVCVCVKVHNNCECTTNWRGVRDLLQKKNVDKAYKAVSEAILDHFNRFMN